MKITKTARGYMVEPQTSDEEPHIEWLLGLLKSPIVEGGSIYEAPDDIGELIATLDVAEANPAPSERRDQSKEPSASTPGRCHSGPITA